MWHLLVLAVLTLAVHPFALPDQDRAIDLQFLPPLTPPPAPTVEVQLRPRQVDQPPPQPPVRAAVKPELQALPQATEVKPAPPTSQRQLLDVARPSRPELDRPVEVERRAAPAPRLQTQQAAPQIPEAPPEPTPVTRPAPALQPQVEVPRAQGRAQPLDASRALPQVPEAPGPEAPPSQVQVLTNQNAVQAPVEIRPRDRAPLSPRVTSQPGAAGIPAPSGGGAPGGGVQGGVGRPSVSDFDGVKGLNGGSGLKGLREALGCEDLGAYKLTPEERAACLQRLGQGARGAPDLGLAVSARNQADYDQYKACQQAYTLKQGAVPNSDQNYGGSSIPGVVSKPKACGPVKR